MRIKQGHYLEIRHLSQMFKIYSSIKCTVKDYDTIWEKKN